MDARVLTVWAQTDWASGLLLDSRALREDGDGTYVLMKSGRSMTAVKALLRQGGREVAAVENCGMATEKVYRSVEEIPDRAGYFSLIIAKETP